MDRSDDRQAEIERCTVELATQSKYVVGRKSVITVQRRPSTLRQKRTLESLGLRRLGQSAQVDLGKPSVNGMVNAVRHLVSVRADSGDQVREAVQSIDHLHVNKESGTSRVTLGGEEFFSLGRSATLVSASWSTDRSLENVIKATRRVMPTPVKRTRGTGVIYTKNDTGYRVTSALQALQLAHRNSKAVVFLRVQLMDLTFTWIEHSNEWKHAKMSVMGEALSFDVIRTLAEITATPRVARSAKLLIDAKWSK
ncbi:large ribosomal subunit protein uL30m [Streptomyces sp. enrichment culture]|uniref:large ribosomal subunit protein uL30m n=1 Tax=Streptomyces sp. enrichment culture TaxID=1795815 RepID=UPI003F545450